MRILIISGGTSSERKISLLSARELRYSPKAAKAAGMEFPVLAEYLIHLATGKTNLK